MVQEEISPSVTLIGVGGIGTPLLPVLPKLALGQVTLWDDDIVSEANLINQLVWRTEDIGKHKSHVAARWLQRTGVSTYFHCKRYEGEELFDNIVIAAVDSRESRRTIWSGVQEHKEHVKLFIDGRLSREDPYFFQLFVIDTTNPDACEAYEECLVGKGQPDSGRRDLDMVPAPLVLSGFIAMSIIRWSRGDRLPWQTVWSGTSMVLESFEL